MCAVYECITACGVRTEGGPGQAAVLAAGEVEQGGHHQQQQQRHGGGQTTGTGRHQLVCQGTTLHPYFGANTTHR